MMQTDMLDHQKWITAHSLFSLRIAANHPIKLYCDKSRCKVKKLQNHNLVLRRT